jgi:hypothetical protein
MMAHHDRKTADYYVDGYLDTWARLELTRKGLKDSMRYGASSLSFDDMCSISDGRIADITDAVINDLLPAERAAIHHYYLEAVYAFPREAFETVLVRAKVQVQAGLRRKGVWLGE